MYIASAATTVKFHEFPSGNVVHNYQPGGKIQGSIKSISWSKDGNWLVLVPHSGLTEIICVKDKLKLLKSIQDVDEPTCATFQNTTKKFIGMGAKSGLVLIFDVKAKHTKKRFPRASSQITHIEFTAKDSHCVASCKNGDLLVYNNITNSPPSVLRIPKSASINCIKTNKIKQNFIVGGSNEGIVCVWDNNTSKNKFVIEAHKAPVNSVAFSPVNSDLILSSGSDRQCCFFDIVDNKCIAKIPVDNSITAIDFSPDGTYFVLGSQNGQVHIFDSRNIKNSVRSFQAHPSSVSHLSFQNCAENSNASSCDISVDATPVASDENSSTRSKRTSDMFRTFIPNSETVDGANEISVKRKSLVSMEAGDSFLACLGLDNSKSAVSIENDGSVFLRCTPQKLPNTICEVEEKTENNNQVIQEKADTWDVRQGQFTSTPVLARSETCLEQNAPTSNIVKEVANYESSDISDTLQKITEEKMKDLCSDLTYEIKSEAAELKRIIFSTQMAMMKKWIKMEDWCNNLREEMIGGNGHHFNMLLEENEHLRARIEFLEEQIKNLTSKPN